MDLDEQILKLTDACATNTANIGNLASVVQLQSTIIQKHSDGFVLLQKNCRYLNGGNGSGGQTAAAPQTAPVQADMQKIAKEVNLIVKFWNALPDAFKTIIIVAFGVGIFDGIKFAITAAKTLLWR